MVELLKIKIIKGEYQLGEKLPSVRELAILFKINPNTIQRALTELEQENLIITKRTSGKFVTEEEKTIVQAKTSIIKDKIDKLLFDMNNMNVTKKEVLKFIKEGEK